MLSNWFLKSFRILLLPFAILFGLVIVIRNWLFNKNIIKPVRFGLPLICVGNLAVGGTGKSPMVEYLVLHLKNRFKVATLSRGYKRKTKGYALANSGSTAIEIGDEPMQFHVEFPDVPVAVGEERLDAIPQLLHDRPDTQVIILDDAFQHRTIKAGLNILLTEYNNLFTRNFYLPTGDLRDLKNSYKRADIIVITKCDPQLSVDQKNSLIKEINPLPHQHVFFTSIIYATPHHIIKHTLHHLDEHAEVLLVTGIANPRPLKDYMEEHIETYHMIHYGDHHIFSIDDWKEIKTRFEKIENENKMIVTTEKDAMRLLKFEHELASLPFYVLPIEHQFLFREGTMFDNIVANFIDNFKQPEEHGKKKYEKDKEERAEKR